MEKSKRKNIRAMELLLFTENGKFKGARLQPLKHKHVQLDSADMRALAFTFRLMADTYETGARIHADWENMSAATNELVAQHVFKSCKKSKRSKR